VFWQVPQYGFLRLDDDAYIFENPHVNTGLSAANVRWAFTAMHSGNWHPLTWISHMLDVELYGIAPGGHHRTSLMLHLANVLLLFAGLRQLTGAPWRSGWVAALFAVHPLHVESVAWVAERKDVLSTLFLFLAIGAYVSYARRPGAGRYALLVLFYALGLMSKPMLVTLPLLLLVLDIWPMRRWNASFDGLWPRLREKLPLFAMAGASAVVTVAAQRAEGAVMTLTGYPLGLRAANAAVSYVRYLRHTVWPAGLAAPYPYPSEGFPAWMVAGAVALLALATWAALRAAGRRPHLLAGWLWYLIGLLPVIGLVQVGGQAMADRYTYWTLTGLFAALAWSLPAQSEQASEGKKRAAETSPWKRLAIPVLATLAVAACAAAARIQAGYWRDGFTLFRHALSATGPNYLAHNGLGATYDAAGDPKSAAEEFRKAIVIAPDYAMAHYNLGRALAQAGQIEEAVATFRKAIEIAPRFARAWHNLGYALGRAGREGEAMQAYREALRFDPQSGESHFNLAVHLFSAGQYAESWSEVHLARRCGYPPNPEFVKLLSSKMADPGPPEAEKSSNRKVHEDR
jgi:protein O-mannosyl-transferase